MALTCRPTAVLESSEDHLDVLLSLQPIKGTRLTGHRGHGIHLKCINEIMHDVRGRCKCRNCGVMQGKMSDVSYIKVKCTVLNFFFFFF